MRFAHGFAIASFTPFIPFIPRQFDTVNRPFADACPLYQEILYSPWHPDRLRLPRKNGIGTMLARICVFIASLMLLIACAWHFGFLRSFVWKVVNYQIQSEFPSVEQISIDEFEKMSETDYLLVDTRSSREYTTSHLRGAINSTIPDAILREAAKQGKSTVVLYCSVGYRSAVVAKKLQDRLAEGTGSEQAAIYNLKGSIFEWANRGKATFKNGEEVNIIDPYDMLWGQLLEDTVQRVER